MGSIKDIFIDACIICVSFIIMLLIGVYSKYTVLVFIPFIIGVSFKIYLKRKKRIIEFIKEDIKKIGYELVDERPLKFKEFFATSNLKIEPTFLFVNNVPINRLKYIRTFRRIFVVKTKDNKWYELNTFIGEKWNDKIEIEVINKHTYKVSKTLQE